MKQNCWEFKKCGREPGGGKAVELGVCPSAVCKEMDGAHGGKNAGRACWVVAGTLCGGKVQGTFAAKFKNCEVCEFYRTVKTEERGDFQLSILLLERLKNGPVPAGR